MKWQDAVPSSSSITTSGGSSSRPTRRSSTSASPSAVWSSRSSASPRTNFTGIDHDVKPSFYIPDRHVHSGSDRRAAGSADASRRPRLHGQGPSGRRRHDEPGARRRCSNSRRASRRPTRTRIAIAILLVKTEFDALPRSARWRRHEYRRDADDAGAARPRDRVRQRRRDCWPAARQRAHASSRCVWRSEPADSGCFASS